MQIKVERLLLLFAIPLVLVGAPLAVLIPPAHVRFEYHHAAFLVGLFLSIPLTLLVTLCLRWAVTGRVGRLLWINRPSVSLRIEPAASLAETATVVRQRLAACGFAVQEHAGRGNDLLFDFAKQKVPKTYSFIDHAFRGTASLSAAGPRPEATISVTFDDTVLIETGEYAKLRVLAGYLLGSEARLDVRQPPMTLVTGVVLAMTNLVALLLGLLDHPGWVQPTFSTSIAAAVLCLWGLAVVLKDRAHLEGLGLGSIGLAASAVPYLMLL